MVLNYQRWTPPCGCSFEQEVDTETNEIKLLFTHSVCGGHVDIAKNSKIKQPKLTKEEIIAKKTDAWNRNHDKHMQDFENHEHIKKIKARLADKVKKNQTLDSDDFLLQNHYNREKEANEKAVANITDERRLDMLLGLESDYALTADDVYDHILAHPEEQQEQFLVKEGG